MGYLRNKVSGAITDNLDPMGPEYQQLADLRDPAATNHTLWEDVPEEDAIGVTSRVLVLTDPGAVLAADSVEGDPQTVQYAGTITDAEFVPAADIVGADTNTRTVTVTQAVVTGTSSPTRTVTTLVTLAFSAASGTSKKNQNKAMTINNAAFAAGDRLTVNSTHSGTGIVDPGGLVVLTYTRA